VCYQSKFLRLQTAGRKKAGALGLTSVDAVCGVIGWVEMAVPPLIQQRKIAST
jgi:hypothetical protein